MAGNNEKINNSRVNQATGWSFAGELAAKLVTPLTNMLLARILAPSVFGIIATVNMVVSLSDIFIEAGFQLYLIQHPFKDRKELNAYASSALWVSLALSVLMFTAIAVFRDPIAAAVGSPGYGNVVAVSGISIPMVAVISILQALYKRDLNYKHLFMRRILGLIVPLVVTVPLALAGWGVWSLVAGSLAGKVVNLLTLLGNKEYHPRLSCKLSHIKRMAPFCMTTLLSYVLSWATKWVDIFIIGNLLNDHYTGLYKNSQTTVTGILGIFTSAMTPVLFSVLCRCSDDDYQFMKTMRSFTERIAMLLMPMGFGMLACRRVVTYILLGGQWMEAADFIGIWGLCTVFTAVYATYCREACRAKGKPHLNVIAQAVSLCVIIPVSYFGAKQGFHAMIWLRSAAALSLIPAYYLVMRISLGMDPMKLVEVTLPYLLAAAVMATVLMALQRLNDTIWFELLLVGVGAVLYFGILCLFPTKRRQLLSMLVKGKGLLKKKRKGGSKA